MNDRSDFWQFFRSMNAPQQLKIVKVENFSSDKYIAFLIIISIKTSDIFN
ncbi:hypothetical protein P278_09160 [Zhouia amylolytica AD3]|uniref:Uncharacterized protein n=1 Tax=Zhouia amylolytica AD3 TaxID=1286632 RepID=W2USB3_9FLAO|nr:hypothetical protein P278_09160 [Zhouia amylolytica AD3]